MRRLPLLPEPWPSLTVHPALERGTQSEEDEEKGS